MTRTYYLIKNNMGCTYWSWKADKHSVAVLSRLQIEAVNKYGTIFINRRGGWFSGNCVNKILRTVESVNFPWSLEESV